ncbi:MAG: DUF3147 family protein [Verrucomicrobia bacterium]|nr:DUF3147 family protein [Verrucomicrobiota bacterium]
MIVCIDPSSLKQCKWHDYVVRFAFGGAITAIAGIIAARFGPIVGGLFLAFPAIFPASATLAEKQERERKEKLGLHGEQRARRAVGAQAAGAVIGSIGLMTFACTVWLLLPRLSAWLVLALATVLWFGVSAVLWYWRKRM